MPEEFHFKHAKVAFSAGEVQEAVDAVHTYLLDAGREGKFYREALELLEEAEQREQLQSWIGTDQTCAGQPKGSACWMEVKGQAGCYVWNENLATNATVTWTGGCSEGRAQGEGTLKWVWEDGEKTSESTGSLTDGKAHGQWVSRKADGDGWEGPYVDGKKHGPWVWRYSDGLVQEGPYVDGKMHGQWVFRDADGDVWEGPFVDGKMHGQWVIREADGDVQEGPYVDGKRHGPWVFRLADGGVQEGPFVEGKKHGQWVLRFANGQVEEGPYVDGKMHGQWVFRLADGGVQEGPYVDGKKHGQWVFRWADGRVEYVTYEDGRGGAKVEPETEPAQKRQGGRGWVPSAGLSESPRGVCRTWGFRGARQAWACRSVPLRCRRRGPSVRSRPVAPRRPSKSRRGVGRSGRPATGCRLWARATASARRASGNEAQAPDFR